FRVRHKMRWWALLLLVSATTTLAFRFPTREEKLAAWEKLDTVKDFSDGVPPGYKLVLVNPLWRHGDRGPTEAFPGDKVTEDEWDFGGGGYGELSPIGMRQHYELGNKLYERYAANGDFLSTRYRAKEVYAKATDRNRTLISAMSNFAGMYSRAATAINGTDYPEIDAWPTSFVPIPIHTAKYMDHEGDPDSHCARQDDLWALAQQLPEYIAFDTKTRTQQTLQYLRDKTGSDANGINFDNIYILRQGMLCESIHFNDSYADWYPWYTDDVKQRVDEIDDQNVDFQNGIFASGMIQGYDLTIELPKIRGGAVINDIVDTANGVLDCYEFNNNLGGNTRCTESDHFLRNLKYYVISAHDSTIAAYLTTLEAKPYVLTSGGYPSYSAAVITEFFIDVDHGNERKFRLLFHDDEFSDFRVITPMVAGCDISEPFCDIKHIQALADKYAPEGGIDTLCDQRLDGPAVDTTKAPPPPASTASPSPSPTTTTKKTDDNVPTTVTTPSTTTSPSSLLTCVSAAAVVLIANLFF
ncbi:hypothetical protein PENTCL1PPCAC_8925, partial [Pristionchus entomophagus]